MASAADCSDDRRMITLRFVTSDDFVSRAIRAAEYGFWATHVETALEDGSVLGAYLDLGVIIRPPDYDKGTRTQELVLSLGTSAAEERSYNTFLRAQLGKPYDLTAVEAFPLGRDWQEPDSWFCSELVAAGLVQCGFLAKLAVDSNKITPRDLLLILSG